MDGEDFVPVFFAHVVEGDVAEDARVADDGIEASPGVDRGLDHVETAIVFGDAIVVGDSFAAGGFDFIDDLLRGGTVFALAVWVAAEVVDDDFRAATGEVQRVGAAEAAASTGHKGYLPFKRDCHEGSFSECVSCESPGPPALALL